MNRSPRNPDDRVEWEIGKGEKVEGGKKDKLSEIGHGQVPFMGPDAPAAAVSFARVTQRATVSFAQPPANQPGGRIIPAKRMLRCAPSSLRSGCTPTCLPLVGGSRCALVRSCGPGSQPQRGSDALAMRPALLVTPREPQSS